ncbi:protein kinase domain-containing protein [Bacillus cihuensis]|uniref:protein kinase domain-containing protein n=1 Tax=Bacillus cihuensis TaxID=1208599 RepID=UPI000405080C
MMTNHSLRKQCNLLPGSLITGKWNKNPYRIQQELGYGANGIVYLAESNNGQVALKLSDDYSSISSEMNILKSFSKVQGHSLGPSFFEADDWLKNGRPIPFYVMEYIKGEGYSAFIEQKGDSWVGVLMLQLLSSLDELHKQGWAFGDLKPDNLIVTIPAYKIRCIDVGGTTLFGRSIKEFTEFFDRGYWGMGSRKADPQYDLFAVAMIIINSFYPKRFSKKGDGYKQLNEMIKQKKGLHPYSKVLDRAVKGQYHSADEMRHDLLGILNRQPEHKKVEAQSTFQGKKNNNSTSQTRSMRKKRKKKKRGLLETLILAIFVSILYVLYVYNQFL